MIARLPKVVWQNCLASRQAVLRLNKEIIMYKIMCRITSAIVVLALLVGVYDNVRALSAPVIAESNNEAALATSWAVTKSYIVDKGNIGGKGCNDSWPGTITQPLCTVAAGLALVQPGEGVFLRAATYPNFTVVKSGVGSGYVTIASYNGENAIINGGSSAILLKGVSYVRIYGLEVKGATGNYSAGIQVTQNSTVSPSYNIIENNVVHDNVGANTMGILIEDGSYNKVINNKVYNNYLSGIEVLSHPANSPNGITGNEITGNESYNNLMSAGNSDGIKLEGPGTKNTLVMNNIVHGNSDDGIDTWNSSYNTIVGNIAFGQTGPGDGDGFKLGGGGTGGYNLVKQNVAYGNKLNGFDPNGTGGDVFYNNIAYNNGNFGFEDGWKDAPCTPSTCKQTFINNIGYNNLRGNFSASAYTEVSHNNLWYSDNGSANVFYKYTAYASLSTFYAASGNRLDNPSGGEQSSLQTNPQFTNASVGMFTVQALSQAIDRGDISNPGQVTAFNRVDIGAFENAASPAPTQQIPSQTPTPAVVLPTVTQIVVLPTGVTPTASLLPIQPTSTPMLPSATPQATSLPATETIYDNVNSSLVYSYGWKDASNQQSYGGSYKVTSKRGATVSLGFTGQSFSILYVSGPSYGNADVYVDGVLVGTINQKTSGIKYQQRWDYSGQLTPGSHTLKLVTRNRSYVNISFDAVIVR